MTPLEFLILTGGVTLVALLAAGVRELYAVMAIELAGFVAGSIAQEFYRGVRARRRMHGAAVVSHIAPALEGTSAARDTPYWK